MGYFQDRIFGTLGLTMEDITSHFYVIDPDGYKRKIDKMQFIKEDDKGNIDIYYYNLDREIRTIYNTRLDSRKTKVYTDDTDTCYVRKRISPENIEKMQDGDRKKEVPKYVSPKGEGIFPWWPVKTIELYEAKKSVNTLILTEGEIKSLKGSTVGLGIVGMPSINGFIDPESQMIDEDINKFIKTCNVKHVIILHDGDCRDISIKQLEKGGDLAKRPENFVRAAATARDALLNCGVQVIYSYQMTKSFRPDGEGRQAKGLDDLLSQPFYIPYTSDICLELNDASILKGKYFVKLNITPGVTNLQNHFGLSSIKVFYRNHAEVIGTRPFVFKGTSYIYNEETGEIDYDVIKNIKDYMRVGTEYYKNIHVPTSDNPDKLIDKLKPWTRSAVKEDFSKVKDVFSLIEKYDDFVVIPSHERYQPVVHNCKNMYKPISHRPKIGPCPLILKMFMHIFGEQYEIGLDYVQLLYKRPTQILPVLCLVSTERETGKTSFLNFLEELFCENFYMTNNDDINSQFNSNWAGKLLIGLDETDQEKNRALTEKIKTASTARNTVINGKGKDQVVVRNFSKFVLCSNHPTRFLYIEREEVRFWIREVPHLEGPKEEDWHTKICDEMDYFLGFINTRKMSVERSETRMWFDFNRHLRTTAFDKLIKAQAPTVEYQLYDFVSNYFMDNVIEDFWITRPLLEKHAKIDAKLDARRVSRAIEEVLHKSEYDKKTYDDGREVGSIYCSLTVGYMDNGVPIVESGKGRGYHLIAKDILNERDMIALNDALESRSWATASQQSLPY